MACYEAFKFPLLTTVPLDLFCVQDWWIVGLLAHVWYINEKNIQKCNFLFIVDQHFINRNSSEQKTLRINIDYPRPH